MPARDARSSEAEGADPQRRTLIRGAALVGLAGVTGFPLSACGDDGADSAAQPVEPPTGVGTPAQARPTASARRTSAPTGTPRPDEGKRRKAGTDAGEPSATPSEDAKPSSRPGEKASDKETPEKSKEAAAPAARKPKGAPIADVAEIPVGSGKLFEFNDLIVTQPVAGEFRGFSPICTHEGCVVDVFERAEMICTCHDSTYRISDGRVLSGPARKPLPQRSIVVADGKIYRT